MSKPLFDALWKADAAAVARLLAEGVSPDSYDEDGWTALQLACSLLGGNAPITKLLLDAGAIPTDRAMDQAAYANNLECLKLLLNVGGDPQAALSRGVSRDIEITELLIERGAIPDGGHLYEAVSCNTSLGFRGGIKRVRLLLKHGAPVNDLQWAPPLIRAASNTDRECINLLLDLGADPARHGDHGETALHCAALRDDCEITELLVARGASVDALDRRRRTPLIWAVDGGYGGTALEVAELLVRAGANIELKDAEGKSAWEYAYLHGYEGQSAISYAVSCKNHRMVDVLGGALPA